MQVFAGFDRRDRFADIMAILDDSSALRKILQREFVSDRDIILHFHVDGLVLIHHPARKLLPGLNAFYHDNSCRVIFIVYNKMNHFISLKEVFGLWIGFAITGVNDGRW